jgi:hypothetical protein
VAQPVLQDSAVGSGGTEEFPRFPVGFSFTATSGPSGENPNGSARAMDGFNFGFVGDVTCLNVTGNRAVIGVENESDPSFGPPGTIIAVVDGGPEGSGLDTLDLFFLQTVPTPATCSPPVDVPPSPYTGYTVVRGDINIHDTHALPTTRNQCKNGGWRTYGVFKNQGDCVSFVATGGKNPPSRH